MPITYKHDYAAFGELVLRSEWMEAHLVERALHGLDAAVEKAAGHTKTGEFEAGFTVESTRHGGRNGDRAEARVVNRSPHAVPIELGHDVGGKRRVLLKSGRYRRRSAAESGLQHVEGLHTLQAAIQAMHY